MNALEQARFEMIKRVGDFGGLAKSRSLRA